MLSSGAKLRIIRLFGTVRCMNLRYSVRYFCKFLKYILNDCILVRLKYSNECHKYTERKAIRVNISAKSSQYFDESAN